MEHDRRPLTATALLAAAFFCPSFRAAAAEKPAPPAATKDATKEHLASLLRALGDDDYYTRESATLALEKLVLAEATAKTTLPAVRAATKDPDPEVARRAEGVIGVYLNVRPTNYPAMPWIDSLPLDYPDRQEIIGKYLAYGRDVCGCGRAPDWHEYRVATVYFIRDLMGEGLSRAEAIQLLDRLVEGDREQCRRAGWPTADGK